jgi:hypothetical protein
MHTMRSKCSLSMNHNITFASDTSKIIQDLFLYKLHAAKINHVKAKPTG